MTKKVLTLCLIHDNDKVLLGMKKRGVGMGKWNGFGGKVNEGENVEEAARRELLEESGLTAHSLEKRGLLHFAWQHKPEELWEVNVFEAMKVSGIPTETEEMKPQWFLKNQIPFESMWPDDKYWLPLFLEGKKFEGTFMLTEDNRLASHKLKLI